MASSVSRVRAFPESDPTAPFLSCWEGAFQYCHRPARKSRQNHRHSTQGESQAQTRPELYKARHLIENFFAKLKQFRAIATRYDKRAINFLAGIYLTAIIIWLN
jgi:transposase